MSLPAQDWKRQWVVLSTNLSPLQCYISYCNKEEEWLKNNSTSKIPLKSFQLTRLNVNTKKANELIIEIGFTYYSLLLLFDSMSKLQQWMDTLERLHCELYYTECSRADARLTRCLICTPLFYSAILYRAGEVTRAPRERERVRARGVPEHSQALVARA